MVLQLIVEILVIDRLKDTRVILCLLSKVFLDTRILTKFGLVMIELFIILPG